MIHGFTGNPVSLRSWGEALARRLADTADKEVWNGSTVIGPHRDDVADLYESAVREAEGAFGRGECFVEKYLDKPRHVET